MTRPTWIRVGRNAFNEKGKVTVRGMQFEVVLSPYVVPTDVRGGYDEEEHNFKIEFRYIDEEPVQRKPLEEHVSVLVGENSRRLFGIIVDVDALRLNAVGLKLRLADIPEQVAKALGHLGAKSKKSMAEQNYGAASRVLAEEEGLYSDWKEKTAAAGAGPTEEGG